MVYRALCCVSMSIFISLCSSTYTAEMVTSKQPDYDVIRLLNQFVSAQFSVCGNTTGLITYCYINDEPCVTVDTCVRKNRDESGSACTIFLCHFNRSETVNRTFMNLVIRNNLTLKEIDSLRKNFTIILPSEEFQYTATGQQISNPRPPPPPNEPPTCNDTCNVTEATSSPNLLVIIPWCISALLLITLIIIIIVGLVRRSRPSMSSQDKEVTKVPDERPRPDDDRVVPGSNSPHHRSSPDPALNNSRMPLAASSPI